MSWPRATRIVWSSSEFPWTTGPPSDVREFAQKVGMHYPIVMGSKGMAEEYGGVPALPTTVSRGCGWRRGAEAHGAVSD